MVAKVPIPMARGNGRRGEAEFIDTVSSGAMNVASLSFRSGKIHALFTAEHGLQGIH